MAALDPMELAGESGVVSESTPGVFIQVKKLFICYLYKCVYIQTYVRTNIQF